MRTLIVFLLSALSPLSQAYSEQSAIALSDSLDVRLIDDGVWVHTSYTNIAGHRFPSNGLLVAVDDGLILVDTAWSVADTGVLLEWIAEELDEKVVVAIITHSHDDRMIGLPVVHEAGIPSMALDLTVEKARQQDAEEPRGQFRANLGEHRSGREANGHWELFYPGPGHADDNIVVYFPRHKLLFGGCLVRASSAGGMGYVLEADLDNWGNAITAVARRFPDADVIVPGHGDPGGRGLLSHTLTLLELHGGEGVE